ncbi:MAG TPA: flagellar biosynthesis protein FlgN [Spirochaetia bacterium]|nr:flagellar biosynthesis protein FlgN [Spirochaetia bacterium]
MSRAVDSSKSQGRVAILKRLKEHLLSQRDKFENYLNLLDKEEESIRSGNLEALRVQVELEKGIVEEIYAFQKVIDPLQDLYRVAYPTQDADVPSIESSLEHLRIQVLTHNEHNRNLLRAALADLRQEIKSLKMPKQAKSPYGDVDTPSVVDIRT